MEDIDFDDLIFFSEKDLFSPHVQAEDPHSDGVSGIFLPEQSVKVFDMGGPDPIEHFIEPPDPKAEDTPTVNVIRQPELAGTQSLVFLDSSGLINQTICVDSDTVTAEQSFVVNGENTGENFFKVKSEVPLDSVTCGTFDNSLKMDLTLVRDRVFDDRKAVILFMDSFCKCNMTQYVITNSSKQNGTNLTYNCKHGKRRPSESCGKRPIQSTVKMGCKAFIRFYVRASGKVVLKEFDTSHNDHAISKDIFLQDHAKATPQTVEIIHQMMDGKTKIANMQTRLNSEGFYMTKDQIRYQVDKILGRAFDIDHLGPYLKRVEDEGGSVKMDFYPDGKVKVLSITTKEMKLGYITSWATTIQVDTTFGYEASGHKLNAILYRNPETDRGEIAVLSFLADETEESYRFALSSFDFLLFSNSSVILIDKVDPINNSCITFGRFIILLGVKQ